MSDNSNLTCKEFLEAIFEQIRPHADNPEEFTSEWERITDELNKQVNKPSKRKGSIREKILPQRNDGVRQLIFLVRTQLAHSYLFDDLWLQYSQGCSVLSDYAVLDRPNEQGWKGHARDGIDWTPIEKPLLPDFPEKRLDFRGSEPTGQPYCSCLDHVISYLICKVWSYDGISESKSDEKFRYGWWHDSSMYLAVLLCFEDNILDDQTFLDKIGVSPNEDDTPRENPLDNQTSPEKNGVRPKVPATSQTMLRRVLSVPRIREKLWDRIQIHILLTELLSLGDDVLADQEFLKDLKNKDGKEIVIGKDDGSKEWLQAVLNADGAREKLWERKQDRK